MAGFIVLRLTPETAVDPATFAASLVGLTVSVFDISFGNPNAGMRGDPTPPIGTASFNPPTFVPLPATVPPPLVTYPAGTTIAQHFGAQIVFGNVVAIDMQSVATAVIPYVAPAAEYPGTAKRPDLRIQFSRGGETVLVPDVFYDIPLLTAGAAPAPDAYKAIAVGAVSAYVTLPAAANPSLAGVNLPSDGSPPNFDDLLSAIEVVVAADPGGGLTLATLVAAAPLTDAQCRNIANEIVWGAEPPLPAPPEAIETMYTNPPNVGSLTNPNEQDRQQFEGQITGFYATRAAKVQRLSRYVYSLAAAIWCEQQTAVATAALISLPMGPAGSGSGSSTMKHADVVLTGAVGAEIPAQYFYALGAMLPSQIMPKQRLRMATGADLQQNLVQITTAFDTGVLSVPPTAPQPPLNPAQATRLLKALAIAAGATTPTRPVADAATVWGDYKAFPPLASWRDYKPEDDWTNFWPTEQVSAAVGVQSDILNLTLCALTQGYSIRGAVPPVLLADFIRQNIVVHAPSKAVLFTSASTVAQLAQALARDWVDLFGTATLPPGAARPDLLPPFTAPGDFDARVQAFIRAVRRVFPLQAPDPESIKPPTGKPPTLALPALVDGIESFVVAYESIVGAPFLFGGTLVAASVVQAAADVFPDDPAAQAWLVEKIGALNAVCTLAAVPGGAKTLSPSLPFSVAEALYARGFISVAAVLALTADDFQNALRGTVAYDQAAAIYAIALTLGPAGATPPESAGTFHPVNPGELANCVPPCHLSPLGPVQYLHELLRLSEAASCDAPFTPSLPGHKTLGAEIAGRRGPLGDLHATDANLGVPLPLIDIVNESLEAMCASGSPVGVMYDTADDQVAGLALCEDEACCHEVDAADSAGCHDPATLLAALPQYSTPALTTAANAAVEPAAFDVLKADFSSCSLPYSQPLDLVRTYLRDACTSRFETMRTFRRCITEFALSPGQQPDQFGDYLWRRPVRIDIAIEYLCITPEEYVAVFGGQWLPACGNTGSPPTDGESQPPDDGRHAGGDRRPVEDDPNRQGDWSSVPVLDERPASLFEHDPMTAMGQAQPGAVREPAGRSIPLPRFLQETCLDYCSFIELWKSGFVAFRSGADRSNGVFPECEPCCLADLSVVVTGDEESPEAIHRLVVFVRLWRKLRDGCGRGYSFTELADICTVLPLFTGSTPNPDFVRQLAAFQMLRDDFELDLVDPHDPPPSGATAGDRTHLLALWIGPAAAKWDWSVSTLVHGIMHHARRRFGCAPLPEQIRLLHDNLDPLSALAGFNPASATDTWHSAPTHTLRFADVLAKIVASDFGIGEILFLFTVDPHLDGDDPFPLQPDNEALDRPLDLPDDDEVWSLLHLRRTLLAVELDEAEIDAWGWGRIAHTLERMGFATSDILSLAAHFFPNTAGGGGDPRYTTPLATGDTAPLMWNRPSGTPFHYDASTQLLWAKLPLPDRAVIDQFMHLRPLTPPEQAAVRNLYAAPRRTLAPFALLFDDFATAQHHLIEDDESEAFAWFRRCFVLFERRIHLIAEHLAGHVCAATGQDHPHVLSAAMLVLRHLAADENFATTDWENDAGHAPPLTWATPGGGALAALLGLTGTGLLMETRRPGGPILWRDLSGPIRGFGGERNRRNVPLPTFVPSMGATLPEEDLAFVHVLNGMVLRDADGEALGGAEDFEVRWTGTLLIDRSGTYEFSAGLPTPQDERPRVDACDHQHWRVMLRRGQQTWLLLKHGWHADHREPISALPLRRGAYEIRIEFTQEAARLRREEDARPQHTGFELKYAGPDTEHRLITVPYHRLFIGQKDARLDAGLNGLGEIAADYLATRYTSSLRDIRRTYQRAFKALLFVHRFGLSAERWQDARSELGYMLAQKSLFAGRGFYPSGGTYLTNAADFDFNLLPLLDDYRPEPASADARVAPALKRRQSLFDWWERTFDYIRARDDVARDSGRRLWHLFDEADEKRPAHAAYLLRHMGADSRHWYADTNYYQAKGAPLYTLTFLDMSDDRWVVRAWHADHWLRHLRRDFAVHDIRDARPALWASDDPAVAVPGIGPNGQPNPTGCKNVSDFVIAGYLGTGTPRRYAALRRLSDCLREHGRDAMVAYLCAQDRTPLPWGGHAARPGDLSSLLLMDVEAGRGEFASRIENAITAVHAFVRRARLGLEAGWKVSQDFARLWDRRFADFRRWEACKCREIYKENWIEWDAQAASQKVESFCLLQAELRHASLSAPLPGGLEYWPGITTPAHSGLTLLQDRTPSRLTLLQPAHEGIGLLGTPDYDARLSWIAPLNVRQSRGAAGRGDARPAVLVPGNGPASAAEALPLWIEAAVRLGIRFWRIAAGGVPEAAKHFHPHHSGAAGCCAECGRVHDSHVDEYYFWLTDARFFKAVDETDSASFFNYAQDDHYDFDSQDATLWHDPLELPKLLEWSATPMVRLAWCRVHDGRFQSPRQSAEGVGTMLNTAIDLAYVGRAGDSLYFSVSGGVRPTGYQGADLPGFRYDIAIDEATILPLIVEPLPIPNPFPAGLPAYPYFVYDEPGAPLFPGPMFSSALAIACALRNRCDHEAALKWYARVFDPLRDDSRWMRCEKARIPDGQTPGRLAAAVVQPPAQRSGSTCCDTTDITAALAQQRAILLHVLETMLDWSDLLLGRGSPEAFEQSRVLLDTVTMLLGRTPPTVPATPEPVTATVASFVALAAPLNPRLIEIYGRAEDRLALIRSRLNARRLREGKPNRDLPFWSKNACCGCHTQPGNCAEGCSCDCHEDACLPHSPYRFLFLLTKAQELAGMVREFGALLLAAFEKGDAEYLAALRADHEEHIATLDRSVRQDQWRDADWQRLALQTSKEVAQTNRRYYATLIQAGLLSGEHQFQDLEGVALSTHAAANIVDGVAEIMELIPDLFVGFPCTETWLPLGTKLSGMFKTISRITHAVGDISHQTGELDLKLADWQRREQEWVHQVEVLDLDIRQIERQILGAERRQNVALRELNVQQRQIENTKAVRDFLGDKFTSHDLYLHFQKELAASHARALELAHHAAAQAERAFNFERGDTARRFLPQEPGGNLREGLLAGERLQLALRQMEQAYLNLNLREYELAKHFSLRLHFPIQFMQLKTSGVCEIELPEWMFDLDHPGQYMRRVRNVTLTIPTVAGPFTGVHARLTLLSSRIRIDARLTRPPHACCDRCGCDNDYEPCSCDPRFIKHFGAREAIATSGGQSDGGLFELNFRDERYLPFEYYGAISRWRIELPPENNFFDFDALSDVILNLNYTAREGGDLLRRAANEVAQCKVVRGWSLFDVVHEFPDAWRQLRTAAPDCEGDRQLRIRLSRRMFPYIPCHRELEVNHLALLFETGPSRERACCRGAYACCGNHHAGAAPCRCGGDHQRHCEAHGCGNCEATCCCACIQACQIVEVSTSDDDRPCDEVDLRCVLSADYPDLYHGDMFIALGPIEEHRRSEIVFKFPESALLIKRVYLLCRYEAVTPPCDGRFVTHPFVAPDPVHDGPQRRG